MISYTSHLSLINMGTISLLSLVTIKDALTRVGQILLLPEYSQPTKVSKSKKYSIVLSNIYISNEQSKFKKFIETNSENLELNPNFILKDISLKLKHGQLLIVIGSVASGKSSLLKALQHEYYLVSGEMIISEKISFCSETPWIISSTVKENIIMGAEMQTDKYIQVIKATALDRDIDSFILKDETLIGDRGINLSGGQKSRINLARALYRDFEILLLDDPLGSVDAQVSNHIFNESLLKLRKEGKTIVMASHQIQFLDQSDKILVLNKGNLEFFGNYEQYSNNKEFIYEIKHKEISLDCEQKEFNFANEDKAGKSIDEEMNESLKFKTMYKYLLHGCNNIVLILIGFILVAINQITFQVIIYWCSHRDKLPDQSTSYFLFGLKLWLISGYLSQFILSSYILNFLNRCNHKLHDNSLKSLSSTPLVFFDNNPSGRIISRFSKDLSNSDSILPFYINDLAFAGGMSIASIIVQISVIPFLSIAIPFFILIQSFIFCNVSPIIAKLRKKESLAKAPILSCMASVLEGLITIRSQRLEGKFLDEIEGKVSYHYKCYLTYQSYLRFSQLYSDLACFFISIINIILIIKARNLTETNLAGYSMVSSINIVALSSIAIKDVIEIIALMFSPQHLLEYQDLPQEPINLISPFKIYQGAINFQNLSLQYQPHLPIVLHDLNFSINPREKIGIVGRTGSGKSSILHVLCRLTEPISGSIQIDSQDYLKAGLHDLRSQISIIPQSSVLFSTSIRDNLDPVHLLNDEKIWHSLKLVGLESCILGFKHQIMEKVGNDGAKFSAGQKQLLGVARALLADNKIVLLDEATSNVDNETDKRIQVIIREYFKEATLIVIAHRIRTAFDMDKILVMDQGRIHGFDKPSKLLENEDGEFFKLCCNAGMDKENFRF